MRYAEALAQRGDTVEVIALSRGDRTGKEVINGVNVFRVQSRDRREKSKFGYLFRIMSFFFRAMWLVTKRHRQQPYDLIHIHSVPDFLVFLAWIPKLQGAKMVLDIHDVMPEFYASKFDTGEKSLGFKVLALSGKKVGQVRRLRDRRQSHLGGKVAFPFSGAGQVLHPAEFSRSQHVSAQGPYPLRRRWQVHHSLSRNLELAPGTRHRHPLLRSHKRRGSQCRVSHLRSWDQPRMRCASWPRAWGSTVGLNFRDPARS